MTATLPGGGTVEIRYGADGEPLVLLTKGEARQHFTHAHLEILRDRVERHGSWSLGPGLPSLDEYDLAAAIAYLDEHTAQQPRHDGIDLLAALDGAVKAARCGPHTETTP